MISLNDANPSNHLNIHHAVVFSVVRLVILRGQLIQNADLQGHRIGGVEVSRKHAGFMVNVDHGTATDYENLIHHVQNVVKEKFGIELEREVRIIGEDLEK